MYKNTEKIMKFKNIKKLYISIKRGLRELLSQTGRWEIIENLKRHIEGIACTGGYLTSSCFRNLGLGVKLPSVTTEIKR